MQIDVVNYMVVEENLDETTSHDQEDLPNVFHWPTGFLDRLPINAGQFWLPDTMEELKYEQMTILSKFLRRWRQYTTGNQMLRQMKKSKGEVALIQMDAATKKVVWRQGVQATPDPMSLMPLGESHSALHLYSLIPEFVRRWFQIKENSRPLRQARQAEALADKGSQRTSLGRVPKGGKEAKEEIYRRGIY